MPALTSGRLGARALVAGSYIRLFQVDPGQAEVCCEIRLINHDAANTASVRLYHCPPAYVEGTLPADEFALIAKDSLLAAKDLIIETGIVVGAGEQIIVFANGGSCTAIAFGFV